MQPRRWIWGRHAPANDFELMVFMRGYRVLAWSKPSRSSFKMLMLLPSPETACSLSTFNRDWVWRNIRMFLMWTAWLFSSCCLSCSKHVFFKRCVNSLHWVHLSWHGMPPTKKDRLTFLHGENLCSQRNMYLNGDHDTLHAVIPHGNGANASTSPQTPG